MIFVKTFVMALLGLVLFAGLADAGSQRIIVAPVHVARVEVVDDCYGGASFRTQSFRSFSAPQRIRFQSFSGGFAPAEVIRVEERRGLLGLQRSSTTIIRR